MMIVTFFSALLLFCLSFILLLRHGNKSSPSSTKSDDEKLKRRQVDRQAAQEQLAEEWWENEGRIELDELAEKLWDPESKTGTSHFYTDIPGWISFAHIGVYADGDPGESDDQKSYLHMCKSGAFNTNPAPGSFFSGYYTTPGPKATFVLRRQGDSTFEVLRYKTTKFSKPFSINKEIWDKFHRHAVTT
jgi:hypothetical protein